MGKRARHITIATVSVFLALAKVALSQVEAALAQPEETATAVRNLEVSDIFIPSELGYVVETRQPAGQTSRAPVIVHIQEAHTNYEGQLHLIGILEQLVQDYGLKLILVEGGEGDVSLAYLRKYGPPDNRKEVAGKYLKAGIISGEEYLDIVSEYPLMLWGVEQKSLYEQNLEAYFEAKTLRETVEPILASVREATTALEDRLASPQLKRLETSSQAFDREEIGLGDYVKTLATLAGPEGIPESTYPNLRRFLEVSRLEEGIALPQVQEEQQRLMAELSRQLDEGSLGHLTAKGRGLQAGSITPAEFYAELARITKLVQLDLSPYPSLSRYMQYVQTSDQIHTPSLAEELDAVVAQLRQQLAVSPESRRLLAVSQELGLMEKLLALQLSPREFTQLQSLDFEQAFAGWEAFLSAQLSRQGLSGHTFEGLQGLRAQGLRLKRFYDVALMRDQALVDNALAKLNEAQQPLAVLITGGFHSPQVTQLLSDQGIGVVVVAPKISQATNERLYEAVLRYKSGHGSFEEVMAIANESAAGTPQDETF